MVVNTPPAPPASVATEELSHDRPTVEGCLVRVVEGAPAAAWRPSRPRVTIGSHPTNDLVIDEPTVSRFHCELIAEARGVRVRDLGSRNGLTVDGLRVIECFARDGSVVQLGRVRLHVELGAERLVLAQPLDRFGALVGTSLAMRMAFAVLDRAAATDATVLLEGETGTGKGVIAETLHAEGGRRHGPFVVVDCGALAPSLLDSELFGHERGAFTGADARRVGAFEEAHGGTLFLDEIGELPAELQPKLLRVLESRTIRPLGQNAWRPVDFRLVAATNRDLRAEVNAGRFRSDLYYRLAVVKVTVPPLRERPDDVPALARALLGELGATAEEQAALTAPEAIARLQRASWPGNVRELRNYLERSLVLQAPAPLREPSAPPREGAADLSLPYADARRRALDAFERAYAEGIVRAHHGKVAAAARAAGIARVYLHRLLRRHGLSTDD